METSEGTYDGMNDATSKGSNEGVNEGTDEGANKYSSIIFKNQTNEPKAFLF